jgi:hypothetical protein
VVDLVDRELANLSRQMAQLKDLRRDLLALKTRMLEAVASGTAAPGGQCPCFEEPNDHVLALAKVQGGELLAHE